MPAFVEFSCAQCGDVTLIASPNAAEAVALSVEAQRKVKPVATVADQVTP